MWSNSRTLLFLKPVKFRNYHLQKLCTIQELLSNLAHVEQVIFNR